MANKKPYFTPAGEIIHHYVTAILIERALRTQTAKELRERDRQRTSTQRREHHE